MAEKFTLKNSYKVEYQRLTFASRQELMTKLFFTLVADSPNRTYKDLIDELYRRLGIERTSAYRAAKKLNLKALHKDELLRLERARDEEALRMRHDGIKRDVPFTKLITEIKDLSWDLVHISRILVGTSSQMIDYYSMKIDQKFKEVGGVHNLSIDDSKQVENWSKHLKFYTEGIKDQLRPNQISSYLRMVGIEGAIQNGMDDIDQSAFTMQRLQEVFAEILGMTPIIGDPEKVEKAFSKHNEDMPDITGTR